ncbi:hypothetical protein ACQ4LE_010086 [Meloidogyne hapla]
MPGKADVHRSLELLEEYHAELFRSSDTELKLAIERVINTFKHSLFNALCDIHEFYENVLTNERIPVGDKIFESRRFAARWERSPILGPFTGLSQLPSLSPIRRPPQQLQPPRLSPNRSPSRRSFGMPSGGGSDTFLHTSPINRIVDENGQEWEVEEVILDVTKTGLGFSISGGRDRELDPVFGDKYIRVTDISPGGAVQKNGRLQVGDVILRVNDCDTANCDHDYAVQALKDAGTYIRLLVKRLKTVVQPGMHRSLSQSHMSMPMGASGSGGGFQRSLSGMGSMRGGGAVGTLQPPIRSQSLHHLPSPGGTMAGGTISGGTLPRQTPSHYPSQIQSSGVKFTQSPTSMGEPSRQPRWVTLRKNEYGLGFNIVGGEDGEPIYISHIMPGGAADLNGNIRKGDVLLQVNDVNLTRATHGEAAVALKTISTGSQVQLFLQYRPREFFDFEERVERARLQMQAAQGGGYR